MIKIDIIGKGKVGGHLYEEFSQLSDFDCRLINSRTLDGVRKDADLALLTVSDSAIETVAANFKDFDGIVCHVSGSTPLEALHRSQHGGVFYLFQSFSKGVDINFREVPILLEATDSGTLIFLKEIAGKLSDKIYAADGEKRKKLHLAGVFSCNFLNEMLVVGFGILKESGLPREILYPLVRLTLEKGIACGSENVRTGPAARHDMKTIEKQLNMLRNQPLEYEVYRAVTELILSTTSDKEGKE